MNADLRTDCRLMLIPLVSKVFSAAWPAAGADHHRGVKAMTITASRTWVQPIRAPLPLHPHRRRYQPAIACAAAEVLQNLKEPLAAGFSDHGFPASALCGGGG